MSTICRLLALFALAIFVGSFELAAAQQQGPKMFTSAEEACSALVQAVKNEDRAALIEILGPTANEIISGGNEIEDRNNRRQFVTKYQEMHRLVREPDGTINLYVGAENWPLPIIMKHKGN